MSTEGGGGTADNPVETRGQGGQGSSSISPASEGEVAGGHEHASEGTETAAHTSVPEEISRGSEAKTNPEQPSQGETTPVLPPRQVIAVNASKGPAAFFNLARKFLVTDEFCDLSALEGAIVSAVDAAHLLERSRLATIVRIQTSYVAVEPKRRQTQATTETSAVQEIQTGTAQIPISTTVAATSARPPTVHEVGKKDVRGEQESKPRTKKVQQGRSKGVPLRRARITITVKRTEDYKNWLDENPYQAMIASQGGDIEEEGTSATVSGGEPG